MPEAAAYAVASRVALLPQIGTITMETRFDLVEPYLTHICRVRSHLASHQRLEVALGLESTSDFVRNQIFRKGRARSSDILRILRVLADRDFDVLLYVFVKPAFLTEAEAIFDTVRTIQFIHSIAAQAPHVRWTAALQPSFVQSDTFLEWLYGRGGFVPPQLWSVAEVITRCGDGPAAVHLGGSSDYPPPIAVAANRRSDSSVCGCSGSVYDILLAHNEHASVAQLVAELPRCGCRAAWAEEVQLLALAPQLDALKEVNPQHTSSGEHYAEHIHHRGNGTSVAFA